MYEIFSTLLKDHKSTITFNCFGIWHILYMLIIFCSIIAIVLILKNKNQTTKVKTINLVINITFGLYIFFNEFIIME